MIDFKLQYEDMKLHTNNNYQRPGKAAILFEDILFWIGRQFQFWGIVGYRLGRLELKQAFLSISFVLFVLYSRL